MFEDVATILENTGMYETVLPLLFVAVLIYGILSSINILGNKKPVNLIVSFIIGFYVIKYTYIGPLLSEMLGYMSVAVTGLFVFLMVLGTILMAAGEFDIKDAQGNKINGLQYLVRKRAKWFIALAVIVFLGIFIKVGGIELLEDLGFYVDLDSLVPYIVGLVIGGSVIWYIWYLGREGDNERMNKMVKEAKEFERDHLNTMNAYGGYHPYGGHYNPYMHKIHEEIRKKKDGF